MRALILQWKTLKHGLTKMNKENHVKTINEIVNKSKHTVYDLTIPSLKTQRKFLLRSLYFVARTENTKLMTYTLDNFITCGLISIKSREAIINFLKRQKRQGWF